jgi:hypothetical protein
MSHDGTRKVQSKDSKKLHHAPVLREYGTLLDLTNTSATLGGHSDTRGPATDIKTH